jgi:hypothetical protein
MGACHALLDAQQNVELLGNFALLQARASVDTPDIAH